MTYLKSVDASIQKSTTSLITLKATKLKGETTLNVPAVVDNSSISVGTTSYAAVGDTVTIYSVAENRVSFFKIINIPVSGIVVVDTPIDFAYPSGSHVQFGASDLSVVGTAASPSIFGVRNPTTQDVPLAVNITRMIFSMRLTSAGDYSKFGNIATLTNGLVCRFKDGTQTNIFNVKSNQELDNLMYDFKFIPASGNAPDGVAGRFAFEKLGSVVKLNPFEDLQFIVQDDLSGLVDFEITVQGSVVDE